MVWGREHICCSWEVNTDSWLPWWSWALGDSWHRTWRGMAGILHYRVGKAEVVGDGRGRHLQSDPASGPLSACWGSPCPGARGRERTEGPGHERSGFEPHLISAEHSPLLHVPCYSSFFPPCLGLLGVAVSPVSILGQWSPSAASSQACRAVPGHLPSLPPPGVLTACCGGSASGRPAGLGALGPRCHWLSCSP